MHHEMDPKDDADPFPLEMALGYPTPTLPTTLPPLLPGPAKRVGVRSAGKSATTQPLTTRSDIPLRNARRQLALVRTHVQHHTASIIKKPFANMTSTPIATVDKFTVYLGSTPHHIEPSLQPKPHQLQHEQQLKTLHATKKEELSKHMYDWGERRSLCLVLSVMEREEVDARKDVKHGERLGRLPIVAYIERHITRHMVRMERQARATIRREKERERLRELEKLIHLLSAAEGVKRQAILNDYSLSVTSLQQQNLFSDQAVIRLDLDLAWKREHFSIKRLCTSDHDALRAYLLKKQLWLKNQNDEREMVCKEEEVRSRMLLDDEVSKSQGLHKMFSVEKAEIQAELERREAKRREEYEKYLRKLGALCEKHDKAEQEKRNVVAKKETEERKVLEVARQASKEEALIRYNARITELRRQLAIQHADDRFDLTVTEGKTRSAISTKINEHWQLVHEWNEKLLLEFAKPWEILCRGQDAWTEWVDGINNPEESERQNALLLSNVWWKRPVSREGVAAPDLTVVPFYVRGESAVTVFKNIEFRPRDETTPVDLTGECHIRFSIKQGYTGTEAIDLQAQTVKAVFYDTPSKIKYVEGVGVYHECDGVETLLNTTKPEWDAETRSIELKSVLGQNVLAQGGDIQTLADIVGAFVFSLRAPLSLEEEEYDGPRHHDLCEISLTQRDGNLLTYAIPISFAVTLPMLASPTPTKIVYETLEKQRLMEPSATASSVSLFPEGLKTMQQHPDVALAAHIRGAYFVISFVFGYAEGDSVDFCPRRLRVSKKGTVKFDQTDILSLESADPVTGAHRYLVETQNLELLQLALSSLSFSASSKELPTRKVELTLERAVGSTMLTMLSITLLVKICGTDRLYLSLGSEPVVQPSHRLPAQCHPKHVDYLEANVTRIFPTFLLQTGDVDETVLPGARLTVSLVNGSKRDHLFINTDGIVDVRSSDVFYCKTTYGIVEETLVGKMLIAKKAKQMEAKKGEGGSIRVMLSPTAPAYMVEALVRNLVFRCDKGRKTGVLNTQITLDSDSGTAKYEFTQSVRVCSPLFDVPPQFVQQEYKEGSGSKRLAVFEAESSFEPQDDLLTEGQICVELISGLEEDKLRLVEFKGCDFSIANTANKGFLTCASTDRVVGWFYNTQGSVGPSITIELKKPEKSHQPISIKREVLGIMRGLHYENCSRDPEVKKILLVTLRGDCGVSQVVIEYQINTINDPTMVKIPRTELTYTPNTEGCAHGVLIAKDCTLEDPDTEMVTPGGFMTVDLVGGGGGMGSGDTFSMIPVDYQDEVYPESPYRLVYFDELQRFEINQKWVATVIIKEEKSVTFKFLTNSNGGDAEGDAMPMEAAAYALRCLAFETSCTNTKLGIRSFYLRFNAGDHPVGEVKVKVTVNVLPPIIVAPPYSLTLTYKEGTKLAINSKITSSRITPSSSLQGAEIMVEIVDGYDPTQDVVAFIPGKEFIVKENNVFVAGAGGKVGAAIGSFSVREKDRVVLLLEDKGKQHGGRVNALFKCFHYENLSKDPTDCRRVIEAGMSIGGETSIVKMNVTVLSIDDMTSVLLARNTVQYISDMPPIQPFDEADVIDEDTTCFEAPHSFLKADLTGSGVDDHVILPSHLLQEISQSGNATSASVVLDGRTCGKYTTKKRGFHVELQACLLSDLQTLVRAIQFFTKGIAGRKNGAKSVSLQIKGGPTVTVTKVAVAVEVAPPAVEVRSKPFHDVPKAGVTAAALGVRFVQPEKTWLAAVALDTLKLEVEGDGFILSLISIESIYVSLIEADHLPELVAELIDRGEKGDQVIARVFTDTEVKTLHRGYSEVSAGSALSGASSGKEGNVEENASTPAAVSAGKPTPPQTPHVGTVHASSLRIVLASRTKAAPTPARSRKPAEEQNALIPFVFSKLPLLAQMVHIVPAGNDDENDLDEEEQMGEGEEEKEKEGEGEGEEDEEEKGFTDVTDWEEGGVVSAEGVVEAMEGASSTQSNTLRVSVMREGDAASVSEVLLALR